MESKIKYPTMIGHKGKLVVGWWDNKKFKSEEFNKRNLKDAQAMLDDLRQLEAKSNG